MASEMLPPKPVTDIWRPDLTHLPSLHPARRLFRVSARVLARFLLWALTRTTISGLEHLPLNGAAVIAINHLGDADAVLALAAFPVGPEVLAKIEMLDFPVVGRLMDWYGMIWLHRGRPDRRALRSALEALEQGRLVIVAPEGRYTLTKGLEPGGNGAAYLAAKAGVPVIPVALTGTQNANVYDQLRCLHRPRLTFTVGEPIMLGAGRHTGESVDAATQRIMQALAALLPPDYRGAYK